MTVTAAETKQQGWPQLTRELSQPEVADLDKNYRFWSSYPDIIYGVFKIGGISF